MATYIAKGSLIDNPSANNIGRAQFVYCVATSDAQTVIVQDVDTTTLGEIYLALVGDSVTIEKAPSDTITLSAGKVSAVGSPRS
jgi:hypothetical protein